MRAALLIILTLVKVLIILIGLSLTFWSLFKGLLKSEKGWENRTLKYFFWTVGLVLLLSGLDFLVAYLVAP